MFIKGRDCLDDKAKLVKLAKDHLPETYVVKGGLAGWENAESQPSDLEGAHDNNASGPWFVKETNKNGGRAIQMCSSASDCIALASDPQETYVIQRHIPNPHLTRDGRKWHLKLYNLLICEPSATAEDESSWTLRCHDEAFLCAASEKWSAGALTPEAQLTIKRIKRFRKGRILEELDGDVNVHQSMLQRCFDIVAAIVQRAIDSKELEARQGKKQFEMFSADFMFDATLEKLYIIEVSLEKVVAPPQLS